MPTSEIYRSSWINEKIFKTGYHVKTIEQVYGINKEFETCYLLIYIYIYNRAKLRYSNLGTIC